MLNYSDAEDRVIVVQEETVREALEQNEEAEAISVREIARRRSRHSCHSAAQARTQGKRRQLRGLWGRKR